MLSPRLRLEDGESLGPALDRRPDLRSGRIDLGAPAPFRFVKRVLLRDPTVPQRQRTDVRAKHARQEAPAATQYVLSAPMFAPTVL